MISANQSYSDVEGRSTSSGNVLEWYSDLDTSAEAFAHIRERHFLTMAIKHLPLVAEAREYPIKLSDRALTVAIEFVINLPTNRTLPKVTVDEDGDVLMVWDEAPARCALTVEGVTLHLVVNPGARSTHIDPTIYYGGHIPPKLLQYIPVRRG